MLCYGKLAMEQNTDYESAHQVLFWFRKVLHNTNISGTRASISIPYDIGVK